ncbi:MAG: antitoxin [Actinobacteria bacterium]|nr:antitoxin [Actinomycetota bacterium]
MDDAELERYEETARSLGLTLSEWARQVLRSAASSVSRSDIDAKRAAVERATTHSFPAPDIEEMLVEIERGYADEVTS